MRNPEAGITVFEVTLVLTVTAIMVAALTPAVAATLSKTKIARATTDMTNIATQLTTALTDMGLVRFTITGTGGGGATSTELMVSDGDIPVECTAAPTGCGGGVTANSWQRPVDNVGGLTDFLERHLVTNNPRGSSANDYGAGAGAWRGPYLNAPIDPDPWGNRYMVNSQQFNQAPNVDVLSAGPDGSIDTVWSGSPLVAGVDDIVVLVQP